MVPSVPAQAAPGESVLVSEVVVDNVGDDNFEYLEVHNATAAQVTIGPEGFSLAYIYADDADTARDVPLVPETPVPLAAGATAVLWLSYTSGTGAVDSFAYTEEDFRAHHGIAAGTQVARITGQAGMSNGGGRGVRVLDGTDIVGWSFYPAGSVGADQAAHFQVPAAPGAAILHAGPAAPSPGTVMPEQLMPGVTEPDPDPDPEPEPQLEPDPDVVTAALQVTEVLPDSGNVGSADGYEFIELFNATSEPINLADYALVYLYPQDTAVNTNEAHWPLVPDDVVIAAGDTLVIWIKNGQNDDLDGAAFNSYFGSDLVLGADLVETFVGGMANGSPRGIAIRTRTGFDINRAYYNMGGADDVSADRSIRYQVTTDLRLQEIVEAGAVPSPGRVQADQVPTGLMIPEVDGAAPTLTDLTPEEIDPAADFVIEAQITDDIQVRRVTLELRNDVDADSLTVNLTHDPGAPDSYRHTVVAADLIGKHWYSYRFHVSDGARTISTDDVQVAVTGTSSDPLRLGLAEGAVLAGSVPVTAGADTYPSTLELAVDGTAVPSDASLEQPPVFVFAESQTDFYFRNGVRVGEDVLLIFDEGSYADTVTRSTPVPLEHLVPGEPLVVSVWAGTKAGPWIDEAENNDDFVISAMRLVLPDGRTLTPTGYENPAQLIQMGDSAGKNDVYDSAFTIPEDAWTGRTFTWDTTLVSDGAHVVSAVDGEHEVSVSVLVDNTPPVVTPSLAEGATYQGQIVLDAEVRDATSGTASVSATLDGAAIELGHVTSSVVLGAGEHVLEVVAADDAGNTTASTTTFLVPEEMPETLSFDPEDGAVVAPGDIALQARVEDPTADDLDVAFYEGHRFDADDAEVTATSGTVSDALDLDRSGGTAGLGDISSGDGFPYQQLEIQVPADAGDSARVRLTWDGTAEVGADVILYALAADGGSWVEVDRAASAGDPIELSGTVTVGAHARDGVITALVQHSEGFAAAPQSDRDTVVSGGHPDDVPRSEYDFTIAWESDTQYYNEEFYDHQVAIHDYLLERRTDLDLRYVIHTGDVVDDYDQPYQWANASPQYARFDDVGLPYGVLAGNHDVGHQLADYSAFSEHFGEARYAGNPWYGGSYADNRGHYDLISAGGIDFLMLYMGWDPGDEAIDWMNEVLARYPDRVALVNLHEYMLTTGGLGPIPQRILDEVVAPSPNVRMVLSGHYHDAFTRIDTFDDDGDGVDDRTVHAMLFDYQGLPEGGLGYLRLLHFDNEGERMMVRTYSPSLERYNSDDPNLLGPEGDPYGFQEFEIGYGDLGIEPRDRTLAAEAFEVEVLTDNVIASVEQVEEASGGGVQAGSRVLPMLISGSVATATWTLTDPGEYGWYVRTADPYGAVDDSVVNRLVVDAAGGDGDGTDGGGSAPGTGPGPGGPDMVDGPGSVDDDQRLPVTGASPAWAALIVAVLTIGLGLVLRAAAGRRRTRR